MCASTVCKSLRRLRHNVKPETPRTSGTRASGGTFRKYPHRSFSLFSFLIFLFAYLGIE